MPLNARDREVFGSYLDLSQLDMAAPSEHSPRPSARDEELWGDDAVDECPAAAAKLPKTLFPLQTRLSARDLELFEAEDTVLIDATTNEPSKIGTSSRDAELFEDYDVKEIPAAQAQLPTLAVMSNAKIGARDLEFCDESHEWLRQPLPVVNLSVRRSGRDDEY